MSREIWFIDDDPPPKNNMGVAGFTVSLLGFVTCGILSPLGLLLSLMGIRRRPKGLAITGMILGLIGTAMLVMFAMVGAMSAFRAGEMERMAIESHDAMEIVVESARAEPRSAKMKAALAQIRLVGTALDVYNLDTGQFPTTEQGLHALREAPLGESRWSGPYVRDDMAPDPWGNDLVYELVSDKEYRIQSLGPDGINGTSDDIERLHNR